ncbi:MAG: exopolysaccharide biosynthesis polyprenyl glycosylphosphotransferase [Bacteroidetes bacterium]|jgi:Undecaprenyl-phosphate galactose phosphotransferase WbaP|nr:exopolysaccharide biosynthesis polyprenyl glycosylphosphotransferase [Bacteroidota bacterium]
MQVIDTHSTPTETAGRRHAFVYHRRRLINAIALAAGDALMIALALALAGATRWWLKGLPMVPDYSGLLIVGWWIGASVARLLPGWGLGAVEELRRTMLLLGLLLLGTAFLIFATKTARLHSRLTVSLTFLLCVPLLPYGRSLVKKGLIRAKLWGLPAAIYGGGEAGRQAIQAIRSERGLGYVPVAVFDDDPDSWGDYVEGIPVLGSTDQSTDTAPVAIVALPDLERSDLPTMLDGPLAHYKQTVILPDLVEIPSLWVRTRDIAGVLGLEITSNLLDPLSRLLKRTVDLTLVLLTLPLWAPLCGMLALLIWITDRHAPLYRQERVGKDGRRFYTLKLRTMVPDADAVLQAALDDDPALRAEWEATYKLRNDPRVTGLGRLLRRASLDELPQLINVLRGEMSLVGPRPLPAYHQNDLSTRVQKLRTRLRPGMTGLWQISGRSNSGNEGIERWDAYYIRNWSVWLDVVILARTLRAWIQGNGAY